MRGPKHISQESKDRRHDDCDGYVMRKERYEKGQLCGCGCGCNQIISVTNEQYPNSLRKRIAQHYRLVSERVSLSGERSWPASRGEWRAVFFAWELVG